jgi:hypothetical protein
MFLKKRKEALIKLRIFCKETMMVYNESRASGGPASCSLVSSRRMFTAPKNKRKV